MTMAIHWSAGESVVSPSSQEQHPVFQPQEQQLVFTDSLFVVTLWDVVTVSNDSSCV
jgi:hypothetical protein